MIFFGIAFLIWAVLHTITTLGYAFGWDTTIPVNELGIVIPIRLVFNAVLYYAAFSIL